MASHWPLNTWQHDRYRALPRKSNNSHIFLVVRVISHGYTLLRAGVNTEMLPGQGIVMVRWKYVSTNWGILWQGERIVPKHMRRCVSFMIWHDIRFEITMWSTVVYFCFCEVRKVTINALYSVVRPRGWMWYWACLVSSISHMLYLLRLHVVCSMVPC